MQKVRYGYGKMEPDLSKCRTSSVGSAIPGANVDMYYCSIYNADCRYAMPFGFDFICKHPENYTFEEPEDEDSENSPDDLLAQSTE
jgi:hypothetical protein